jgi:oxygen-independent coproporphyrinogen III oxidase
LPDWHANRGDVTLEKVAKRTRLPILAARDFDRPAISNVAKVDSSGASNSVEPRSDGAFVFHHPPKFTWDYDVDLNQKNLKWGNYHFYVHVPFCRKICNFCTFERKLLRKGAIEWFDVMLDRQMKLMVDLHDFSEANVESVYLGGGTASLLSVDSIGQIVARLRNSFGLKSGNVEITLECEPGTKQLQDLIEIRRRGVNRISIGAQSFDDAQLKVLNRSHDSRQTLEMLENVKLAGFENVHVDLMYGLPGQDMRQWRETVRQVIDLDVQHLSAYPLIVFPSELLARSLRRGALPSRPEQTLIDEMSDFLVEKLSSAGFERYSTSDFALPNFQCRYVKSTWDSSDYLGMGPGAYSRHGNLLWEDDVIHGLYEEKLEHAQWPIGKAIRMTPEQQLARDVGMGLCLLSVDIEQLQRKAGARFFELFSEVISDLEAKGFLTLKGTQLSLTDLGTRHATHVMKSFCN